ncbi:MAG: hypothetical protein MI749_11575 [Desulfovibrionales bacterium]|nr:hypothetical protein [Desulfovibrionales bacterium]
MTVYLLVAFYSLSHTHSHPQNDLQSIGQIVAAQGCLDGTVEKWHPDHHHSLACKLVSQAASALISWECGNYFRTVQNSLNHFHSHELQTPTKRLTRAPPLAV